MIKIGFTGASSEICKEVIQNLDQNKYEVFKLGRGNNNVPFQLSPFHIQPTLKIDLLIHFAWNFETENPQKVNVNGSIALINWAKKQGTKLIFVSSLSAFEKCKSIYGKTKLEVEKVAIDSDFVVVRPGLIYSLNKPFGVTGAIFKITKSLPICPLVCSESHQYPIELEDFAKRFCAIIENYHLLTAKVISIRAATPQRFGFFLKQLFPKTTFIPINWLAAYFVLRTLEFFGFKTRLSSDSLLGLAFPDKNPPFIVL